MIDLHSHTTASDGEHPPEELIRRAFEAGVRTLSLTDHDTVAGIAAAQLAAKARGMTLIPGIELSAFVNGREVHILGHFVDPLDARLNGLADFLRVEREKRMVEMLAKLAALGMTIPMAEVVAMSGGKNLGRPHLARAMVARGLCVDVKDAFDRFLGNGQPAFVERYELSSKDAIALIHGAKGTATIAHPHVNKLGRDDIALLKSEGLNGIEVYHSDHSLEVRERMLAIAKELDLVPTAGSDFHGEAVVKDRKLGTASMNPDDFAKLKARAT